MAYSTTQFWPTNIVKHGSLNTVIFFVSLSFYLLYMQFFTI